MLQHRVERKGEYFTFLLFYLLMHCEFVINYLERHFLPPPAAGVHLQSCDFQLLF